MNFPSRVTSYKESVIEKFPIILRQLIDDDLTPSELFYKVKKNIDILDFIDALDYLFILGKIVFVHGKEDLHYVK